MKFCVIIATRGKPHQAVGVIEAAKLMASGEHEVKFIVACDDDDPANTRGFFANYLDWEWEYGNDRKDVRIECGPRPAGVSACWNRCVGLTDADVILTLPDDGLICTPYWDKIAEHIWTNHIWAHPFLAIGALNDTANPGQATLFIVGKEWVRLCGLFDERYPAWFSDTAIAETYSFITGGMLPIFPINVATKPGVFNPRLRDMQLWWRLYGATRRERIETARNARHRLDLATPPNLAALIAMWEKRDEAGLPASEEIVRQIPNPKPPDEHYMTAKAAAERYLAAEAEKHPA